MVVSDRPLKRAKRRITAGLHDFRAFPSPSLDGERIQEGPFRSKVKLFLSEYARAPPLPAALIFSPSALTTWRVSYRIGDGDDVDGVVEMDVIEEDVSRSRTVYCDQCRVVGWSGHPVCKKRYHFIIRNSNKLLSGYNQMCRRCGFLLHMLNSRCQSCKYEMTVEDFEDWAHRQLDDSTHLLHGVVHGNGYGHLLRVNGREGGSKYISGTETMGFWDRLCKMLRVRKVTVMDMSKKHGMEYRLLHAVSSGHPWYGKWGYEFGAGSFSITSEVYKKAVEMLSSIPLSIIFSHTRAPHTSLHDTISFYWSLSDCKIETIKDLFIYLSNLLHESHQVQAPYSKSEIIANKNDSFGVLCTWDKSDIEKAEDSMVKVLKAVGVNRWVTWKALKGATCKAVASQELLDCCLKGLGGKICGDGLVVVGRCNADSNALEYRLEAASNKQSHHSRHSIKLTVDILLRDLKFLYDSLLNPSTMHKYNPEGLQKSALNSAMKLLDCKQFVKDYAEGRNQKLPNTISVWCGIELVNQPKDYVAPPPELLILPTHANVADLKLQAANAFQETYLILQKFQAEQIVGLGNVSDLTNLRLLLGENVSVKIRGRCFGDEHRLGRFRMERGLEHWTVDCACGAKDDDGERMMACDTCGVWQHTRCSGISDRDPAPVKFICTDCAPKPHVKFSKGRVFESNEGGGNNGGDPAANGRCKDEISQAASTVVDASGSYGLMTTVG